jgi:hypothetical protein
MNHSALMLPFDERFSKVLLVLTANLWKARLQNKKHLTKKPTAPTEAEQGSN